MILCVTIIVSLNAQKQFVSTKGEDIIGPNGKPLLLRGINLGNWLVPEGYMFKFKRTNSPRFISEAFSQLLGPYKAKQFWEKYRDTYITENDIAFIKKIGLNSIRVPFDYRLFVSEDQETRIGGVGFDMLDRVVSWCREHNLYVILDMHCAPGGQTGDNIDNSYGYPFLFESDEAQKLTADIWRAIAQRYSDEPIVIGYDLLNEPIATYFNPKDFNDKLEPLYKKVVTSIREVDTNHIVFLGGAQWDGNFKVFGPPFDAKTVYTYHRYWCDTTQAMVQEFVDFRSEHHVPIWMGESGENSNQWIDAWRRLNEKNNFGWCFWPYKKMDALTCIASVPKPAEWDSIVAFVESPRSSYEQIRQARPSFEVINQAFAGYLEHCTFGKCSINEGYIRALGLHPLGTK